VFAEQRAQLRRSLRRVETSQGDTRDQAFAVPLDQRLGERVCAIELRIAIGADDERAPFAQLSQQMSEEPERAAVGPVQVVRVKEQSLFTGEILKHLRDGVEEKQPFLMRLQLGCSGKGPRRESISGASLAICAAASPSTARKAASSFCSRVQRRKASTKGK